MERDPKRKRLILWVVAVALVTCGALYLRAEFSPTAQRGRIVGTWRLFTNQRWYWHIVLREDGTGTMSTWNYQMDREERARDIVWSVDLDRSILSLRAVKPRGHFRGEMGGRYTLHGGWRYLRLDHRGGENPGTLMYERIE